MPRPRHIPLFLLCLAPLSEAAGFQAAGRGEAAAMMNHAPAWSPAANWILFDSDRSGAPALYLINPDTRALRRLPAGTDPACCGRWSREGDSVLFESEPGGRRRTMRVALDGGDAQAIPAPEEEAASRAADGTALVASQGDGSSVLVSIAPDGARRQLTRGTWASQPSFSPDGRLIVYEDRTGHDIVASRIMLMERDGGGRRILSLGTDPSWSPDGALILFKTPSTEPGGFGWEIATIRHADASRASRCRFTAVFTVRRTTPPCRQGGRFMNERIRHSWTRLPVVLRAILGGAAIVAVGVAPWSALAAANLRVASGIPWASIVGLTYLTLLWSWLDGRGWPRTTADVRRRNLRANAVRGRLLTWTVVSGTLFASGLIALTVMGWMLAAVPPSRLDEFTMLSRYPWWTTIPMLLTSSLVAGVVEEAAFRGYMQVPLERRHGPVLAIAVVAIVFTMAHFPPPVAWPGFVLGAMGWGLLAYLSGSILPGIILHALVNASVWIWALLNRSSVERVLALNALQDGPSAALALAVGVTITLAAAAALAFVKLAKVRHA